jgi:hypothetical protein
MPLQNSQMTDNACLNLLSDASGESAQPIFDPLAAIHNGRVANGEGKADVIWAASEEVVARHNCCSGLLKERFGECACILNRASAWTSVAKGR